MNENKNENVTNEKMEEAKNITICIDCGREIDLDDDEYYTTANGDIICEDCYYSDYFTCTNCGEIHHIDDSYYASDTEEYYCKNCLDELYYCSDCEKYFANSGSMVELGTGDYVCNDCLERGDYSYCESCGEYYYCDDMEYCEEDDEYYCCNCFEEYSKHNIIKSYHAHKHEFTKRRTHNEAKQPLYFGFELEVESGSNCCTENNYMAQIINDKMGNDIVFENDGSLTNGFEIISQPMTLRYIQENESKFEKMLQLLIDNGYISHNSNHCGLHIHLTRDYFTPNEIDKMQLLIEKFKKELLVFSRRNHDQQTHWAKFITDNYNNDEKLDIDYIKKYKNKYDRYYALNLTNSETIEFRLLKGTLKYNTFMASFELLNNISKIVKKTSVKNLEKIEFKDIIKYGRNNKHLKTYCIEKNLIGSEVL